MSTSITLSAALALCLAATACHQHEAPPAERAAAAPKPVTPPVTTAAVAATARAATPEDRALVIARGWIVSAHPDRASCFTYAPGTPVADATEIEVRERHDAVCGGDPATAPVAARLRVHAAGALERYAAVTDSWEATQAETSIDLSALCTEESGDVMEASLYLGDARHRVTPALRALVEAAGAHGADAVFVDLPDATSIVVIGPATDRSALAWARQQQSARVEVDSKGPRCAWLRLR